MDVRKVRHTLARLNEVNEQMTSLSDNIWLDIDHRDNESVTAGADFIQQYNQAAQQLSKATASIEHLLLSYFHQERENIEPKIEHGSGDSKSNERMILELDRNQSYLLNDNFTFKRPYGFIFNGIAYRNLMTWKAVYLKVLEVLKSSHPTKFEQLTTDELFISNRGNPLFSHTPSKLRVAYKLPESFYAEINMSANTIKQNLIIILEFLVILKKACVFINEQGYNQPTDTSLQIGQFYDITYTERSNKLAPHTEDIE